MARQHEQIVITIARPEVSIQYLPVSAEAEIGDERAAAELALHALAQYVISLREHDGLSVPRVLTELVKAETWRNYL